MRRARTAAAAGRDRCRGRRRTPAPGPDPPRQRRTSADDRRPERPRGRTQYRARGLGPRSATRPDACRACRRGRGASDADNRKRMAACSRDRAGARATALPIRCDRGAVARARTRRPAPPGRQPRRPRSRTCRRASNPPDARGTAPRVPRPRPARQPLSHEPAAQADHNLAEMAHQLEAALRRAPAPEGRPPVTDPLAAPGQGR